MKKQHILINGIEYKECSSCKEILKLENFSKYKSSIDGLKPYCKACASKKGKVYRNKYRDDDLRRKKEWYISSKEKSYLRTEKEKEVNSKVCSKCNRKLDINNFRERANGGYYTVCRECENLYNKKYKKTHPETYKANHAITEQRRRKKVKEVISNFNNSDWKNCKAYFNNECAYCSKKLNNLTQDHVIPLSKGGNYTKDNILPVCRSCNSKKCDKDFIPWFREQPFYSKEKEEKILKYLSTFK